MYHEFNIKNTDSNNKNNLDKVFGRTFQSYLCFRFVRMSLAFTSGIDHAACRLNRKPQIFCNFIFHKARNYSVQTASAYR